MTEDNSPPALMRDLSRKLLHVAFGCWLGDEALELLPPDDKLGRAMQANGWKERGQRRIDFIRTLATELARGDVFVMVHVDGDCVWSQRQVYEHNARVFQREIEPGVRRLLQAHGKEQNYVRLLLIVPFYSIEAWLYQNGKALGEWYDLHHPGKHKDREQLTLWARDPGLLDEVHRPKDTLVVRDRHNCALAATLPAKRVFQVGKSFAEAVAELQRCAPLAAALGAADGHSGADPA